MWAPCLVCLASLLVQPLPLAAADAGSATAADERLLSLVNDYRVDQGLAPLLHDPALTLIARANSQRMADKQQLGHDDFEARYQQSGRRACVENLAAGYRQLEPLLAGWQDSPGHDRNLRDARVSHAGIGEVQGYVTLMACSLARRSMPAR